MKINPLKIIAILWLSLGVASISFASDESITRYRSFGEDVLNLLDSQNIEQLNAALERGMSPNSFVYAEGRIARPYSLLEYACFTENAPCIDCLIKAGADSKMRNANGAFYIEQLIEAKRSDLAVKLSVPTTTKTELVLFEAILWDYWVRRMTLAKERISASQIRLNNLQISDHLGMMIQSYQGLGNVKSSPQVQLDVRISYKPRSKESISFTLSRLNSKSPQGVVSCDYELQFGYWIPTRYTSSDY